MARKPKERKEPIVNKEYIWELEVDEELQEFKVFLTEDECITYANGAECERLKIQDKRQMQGVLQINCETLVLDEVVPFQLENGIPYVKLDGEWIMSDTTLTDRIEAQARQVKKQSYMIAATGVFFFLFMLGQYLITGSVGEWPAAPILGIFCFACSALQLVRLKQELEARGMPFSWKL